MYLKSSRYHLERAKKKHIRFNWPLIAFVVLGIIALSYFQAFIVPTIPPPFMPTQTATRSAHAYAEDAARLFKEGILTSSVEMYKQAIRVDPTNADLYIALAQVQIFSRDFQNALQNSQNAVLRAKSAKSYAVYGWALYNTGDLQGAESILRDKSLVKDSTLALAHAYYAFVIIDNNINDWKTASAEAKRALELAPTLLEAHMAMGYVFMATANYPNAIEEFNQAIKIHDKLSVLYLWLGDCYRGNLDPTNAIQNYSQAQALDQRNPDPVARIARTYYGEGQFGKALQYAQNARDLDPLNARLRGLLGVLYFRNGDYMNALQELEYVVHGGTVTNSKHEVVGQIEPLTLELGVVAEYYWTYALTLAKLDRCDQAVPYLNMLQQLPGADEVLIENVTSGMLECKVITPTPTFKPKT